MNRTRPISLRNKLLAIILLTTLVALIVALCAMAGYDLRAYHRNWIADMTTQAELLGGTVAPALKFDDSKVAQENLALLRFRPKVSEAAIYNARGGLFATYISPTSSAANYQFPRLPETGGDRVEGQYLILYKRIVDNGEILGTVYLRANYRIYDRVRDYAGIALAVALVAMLVALLMSAWLQRIVTRPILAIGRIAREVVERRDYSRRAQKISDDEVGMLVDSFNDMLAEIERRTGELETLNEKLALEIAERRRTEAEIARLNTELEDRVRERTAQLELSNQELDAFCSSVSHDLRAPLRSVDGFSQLLIDEFSGNLPAEGHRYLTKVRASTQRMAQLIEDLLNLSRVSRAAVERVTVDVGDLARQVLSDINQREPRSNMEIIVWDGMTASADPRLLRAALENLLGNAWKFTSHTDHPRIEVGMLRDNGYVTFFVRDNGAGFDMAYSDKLFGAFQRLHSAKEFPGTGIGLATVQRIVRRHGGRIWADAQVGSGAVFFFTLAFDGRVDATPAHLESNYG